MRAVCLSLALLASLAGALVTAAPAAAQRWEGPSEPPSREDEQEARALAQRGQEAAAASSWAEALDFFVRSYAMGGNPRMLFNVGFTLRAVGRFREAQDAFRQLIGLEEASEQERADAEELLEDVGAKIAVLNLTGLELYDSPSVSLDGADVEEAAARPLRVEADPGPHVLRVDVDAYAPFEWEGRLGPGDSLTLEVALEPLGSPWYTSPWLWAGVGAVVVIAAVITAVALQSAAQLDPRTPNNLVL